MTRASVIISPEALNDLALIIEYLRRDSPHTALPFVKKAKADLLLLTALPQIGYSHRFFSKPKFAGILSRRVSPTFYRIFYLKENKGIRIIRVLHDTHNIEKDLLLQP